MPEPAPGPPAFTKVLYGGTFNSPAPRKCLLLLDLPAPCLTHSERLPVLSVEEVEGCHVETRLSYLIRTPSLVVIVQAHLSVSSPRETSHHGFIVVKRQWTSIVS